MPWGGGLDRAWLQRHQLMVFFVLAYAITWAAQIPAYLYAYRENVKLSNEADTQHVLDQAPPHRPRARSRRQPLTRAQVPRRLPGPRTRPRRGRWQVLRQEGHHRRDSWG